MSPEQILEQLPELLRSRPDFREKFYQVLREHFGSREETNRLLQELAELRRENTERFEAMDRRFEAMDRRFEALTEAMDKRFEAMDRRFEALTEAMDRRFETLTEAMNRRFEAVEARLDRNTEELQDQRAWTELVVGRLQTRSGRNLENVVAGTLRVALNLRSVRAEDIELRRKFVDQEGQIGPPGRSYEYDVWVADGETTIFEVKSMAEQEDVLRFNDKAELVKEALGLESVRKVVVALDKPEELRALCKSLDILLV